MIDGKGDRFSNHVATNGLRCELVTFLFDFLFFSVVHWRTSFNNNTMYNVGTHEKIDDEIKTSADNEFKIANQAHVWCFNVENR